MEDNWYVYILRCRDDSLYTGIARDVEKRVAMHNRGIGAKYTRGRTPVVPVYREACQDKSTALRRELEIKALSRQKKLELIG